MRVDNELVDRARTVAADTLAANAGKIDAEARFPADNLAALHAAGLMAVCLPPGLGGHDASIATYGAIAAVLGEYCASTGMVWAMHGQQLFSLLDHAAEEHTEWLARAGAEGFMVGSVTTDKEGGADLFTTGDALVAEDGGLRLRRQAPVVTGGGNAGFYLVSMRTDPDAPTNSTCLVLVDRAEGVIEERGSWDTLGMRGTHSVPMAFDVLVPRSRVLPTPFSEIARLTLVPAGHVGWAGCWLGVARGAAGRLREALRRRSLGRSKTTSEVVYGKLAEIRLKLDLLESLIWRVATEADELRAARRAGGPAEFVDPVLVNNLKLAGSRLAMTVVDELVDVAGMRDGYQRSSPLALERAFRDLRSGALMFHNDRLLQANGRLVLAGSRALIGLGRS